MGIQRRDVICYRLLQIYRKLTEEYNSVSRRVLSVIQIWEIISVDTGIQSALPMRNVSAPELKDLRNKLAHADNVPLELIDKVCQSFLSKDVLYYLINELYPFLNSLNDYEFNGNYGVTIKEPF